MKLRNILNKILIFTLVVLVAFVMVGCKKKETVKTPSITITPSATTIMKGENVTLDVVFNNFDASASKKIIWEISDETLISIKDNTVSCLKQVVTDTEVTITGYAFANTSVSSQFVMTVKAKSSNPEGETWGVKVTLEDNELALNEETTVTVVLTNCPSEEYTLVASEPTLVSITGNTIKVIKTKTVDKIVAIRAYVTGHETYEGFATLTVKAPVVDGQVGDLKTEMIEEIGNSNITVYGSLQDIYQNVDTPSQSKTNTYYMEVKMSTDRWYGSWYAEGKEDYTTVDNYKKGSTDGLKDQYGNTGHGLCRLYVDKNNQVAEELIVDYISRPSLWESQHLWNHLSQLAVYLAADNIKFTYDAVNEVYVHKVDVKDEDDLYLMTYLSYCLTPMLSDTLDSIYLTVEDGHITKFAAQTEILYYLDGELTTAEYAEEISYSTLEVRFSDIGTTVVPEPATYEAPANADKLENALTAMKAADNYTFNIVEKTTYAPTYDDSDYSLDSTSTVTKKEKVTNTQTSTGTVGLVGYVTKEAILLGETGKYTYSLDDKLYHTEWEGYLQNADELYGTPTYEYFTNGYDKLTSSYHLTGNRLYYGQISDMLPKFDFSSSIFKFTGTGLTTSGKTTYIFQLRNSDITNQVSREVTIEDYGKYGASSTTQAMQIVVDGEGHIIQISFPYNISDIYYGSYTITFSKIGTTKLDEDQFDGYVHREVKKSWAEYTVSDYSPTHSTKAYEAIDGNSLLEIIIGSDYTKMPTPELITEVFGDAINGPWFDWNNRGTDDEPIWIHEFDFNIKVALGDQNQQLSDEDFTTLITELTDRLERIGYAISYANTDTSGGALGTSNRYVTWINGDVEIVLMNNHTRYFFFEVYKTGDWTLKK